MEITTDLIGYASLNCVYNFDLASENALISGSGVFSDEITFANRILTDYSESVGNRVLVIDDIINLDSSNYKPRFIKTYTNIEGNIINAVKNFTKDVKNQYTNKTYSFPKAKKITKTSRFSFNLDKSKFEIKEKQKKLVLKLGKKKDHREIFINYNNFNIQTQLKQSTFSN